MEEILQGNIKGNMTILRRGWLILDKPEGISSAHVVRVVKRAFKGLKIGHAGTLDPLASGVLPLALGEATKTVPYVMSQEKGYTFDLVWGEKRTTDDSEGEVLERSKSRPSPEEIKAALPFFKGVIQQKPPLYSALKVGGRRACDLARQGQDVSLEARPVRIESFDYLGPSQYGEASRFRVQCGPGTYIRSLARDLAAFLNTVGYARYIRRHQVGQFQENEAVLLERLEKGGEKALIKEHVLSLESVLDDIPALSMSWQQREKLCQGQAIRMMKEADNIEVEALGSCENPLTVTCKGPDNYIFAIGKRVQDVIKPERILKTE